MLADIIDLLASRGQHCFDAVDLSAHVDLSTVAMQNALRRLKEKGKIAMPYRGFYVVIPPEYQALGCLPAEQFIPDLMSRLKEEYYAGLLTAAEYLGAAHHRPQVFQVVVGTARRSIACGRVRVRFIVRKNVSAMPVQRRKTPRGYLSISSREATAFDLVGYPKQAGGVNSVATVLGELAEGIDPKLLAEVAHLSPLVWAQRLGYLLDQVGAGEKAGDLAKYIERRDPLPAPLTPARRIREVERDRRWRILVNAEVEAES